MALTKEQAEQIVRRHIARCYLAHELHQALMVLVPPKEPQWPDSTTRL
jgi:hypothetical protein